MERIKRAFLSFFIFIFIIGLYLLAFISTNSIKGSFHTDEPGVVLSSLDTSRKIYDIFKDAASIAQPPLEHVVREKIYQPIGNSLGIAKQYPELFHRFLSLLWWLFPIGYFCYNLKDFSPKRIYTIVLGFLFILSSEFFRGYLTEARHYSAIGATFATMIVILLSDKVSYHGLRYKFFLASLLPPLLHLISFPYYLVLVVYFFYKLQKESYKKHKEHFFDLITLFSVYFIFVVWLYFLISKISVGWQHPSINNINIIYINSRIKWTLDWMFYGTPFYLIFKTIPNVIRNNFLEVFGFVSLFVIGNFFKKVFKKRDTLKITAFLLPIVTTVWPVTIIAVVYRSGMFSSERYSIAILVIVFFYLSLLISNAIWNLKNKRVKNILSILAILLTLTTLFIKILPIKSFSLESDENKFIKENAKIISNSKNILIADNGLYSASISLLSIINNIPLKASYIECHNGTFFENQINTFNTWLKKHSKDNVYFLTSGKPLSGNNTVVWTSGLYTLYKIKTIDEASLCSSNDHQKVGECYLRCTKGHSLNPDGWSLPGVTPHIDIYRN